MLKSAHTLSIEAFIRKSKIFLNIFLQLKFPHKPPIPADRTALMSELPLLYRAWIKCEGRAEYHFNTLYTDTPPGPEYFLYPIENPPFPQSP
ncbi:hypothetical protein CDAR_269501 [Caerostris darwini]|uniref:Uncharacterized protein n=1 Tax=Caerostris darwini TaxID=1538125 RepID=A0AAV4VQA3_9ARAC|nr:hypothetical protein CDAR_269501 [Caerostris darwini]